VNVDPKVTGEVLPFSEVPNEEERSRVSFHDKQQQSKQVEYKPVTN